ncbi:MAG: STAS domain-containing protein [Flavobacteriales bacterium]|nr:STAS domain-containing protein [Flavobacteriales bacterium]
MAISTDKQNGFSLVKVSADKLDTMIAPDLKSEFVYLEKSGEEFVIVDLTDAKYCDSSGLSALLVGNRLLKQRGGLILFGLQPNVKKLVEISQLHTVLNIADDFETAKAMI